MYNNQPTTIPAYGAHYHHHHSDLGDALGVFALLSLILSDPNPGKTIRDLAAGIGMPVPPTVAGQPVGGDASATRRSPQGGSNKPSIVRRPRVEALWSHISVHNPSHNHLAALVL